LLMNGNRAWEVPTPTGCAPAFQHRASRALSPTISFDDNC
jgi:hypothetical protein